MGVRSAPRRTWSSWYSLRSLFSAAAIGAAVLPRRAAADMLYVVGGEVGQSATNSMERFNLDDPDAQWDLSMSMPSERLYHGVGVVNEEMYLVGGRGDKHNSITGCGGNGCNLEGVLRYDALVGEWDDIQPMHDARIYAGVVGDDETDLLYVTAGTGAKIGAEALDTRSGTWANLPDLTRPRSGCAAVVVDSILWVFGGYDGNDVYLDSGEWFDITNDEVRCRADPDCVEDVTDWYEENADGQHTGGEWTGEGHAAGTKDTALDPSLVGGRRRRRRQQAAPLCDGNAIATGLTDIASACGGAAVPTSCSQQCGRVYSTFWAVCAATVQAENPEIVSLLAPLEDLCIGGLSAADNGFDIGTWENSEETGPQLTHHTAGECPPGEPGCDTREIETDGAGNMQGVQSHACGGGECEGEWRELDERMIERRAYHCATIIDHDADGDQDIYLIGGKSHNHVALKSGEVFDIERRTWTAIPDMRVERWVSKKEDGRPPRSPRSSRSSRSSSHRPLIRTTETGMLFCPQGLACASHQGKIYAVGGKLNPPSNDFHDR